MAERRKGWSKTATGIKKQRKQDEANGRVQKACHVKIKLRDELLTMMENLRGRWKIITEETEVGGSSHGTYRGKYSCKRVGKKIKTTFTPIFLPNNRD